MKKFSLSLLVYTVLLIPYHAAFAQLQMLRDQGTGNPVMANPYPEVKGTPYWMEFGMGSIIFSERDTASNLVIAFNAFNHTLVYQMDRDLMAYSPGKVNGFILGRGPNAQVFRTGYMVPGIGPNRFVEVLVDGDYTLVNHKFKKIVDDPGATYGSQRSKVFQNAEDLIVYKDGEAFVWRARKKNLERFFGVDGYKKLKDLSNSYGLDLKEKSDVRRLIMLLNNGN
ncbi:hypothetical protein [Cecembia lonarensis]|uniref:Uncharacterized protein n=1 Tax=Cecembia lonarensis (strain CCUG 58316 / KCTC 22772 / LW9) TaxID=1225176 RepID=K1KV05_CECL9|nr:hypothetical protein [Cecembia lonarensis]EKB48020.1 hypothetical protein B879_03377 [Cecembia lonarensis LW9]